jgi:hypothetical protein
VTSHASSVVCAMSLHSDRFMPSDKTAMNVRGFKNCRDDTWYLSNHKTKERKFGTEKNFCVGYIRRYYHVTRLAVVLISRYVHMIGLFVLYKQV